jgi:hypothetical protein
MSDQKPTGNYRYVQHEYREIVMDGDREVGMIQYMKGTGQYGTPGRTNFRPTLDEARAVLVADYEREKSRR